MAICHRWVLRCWSCFWYRSLLGPDGESLPWSIPALFAQGENLGVVSYVIVILTSVAGVAGTLVWWEWRRPNTLMKVVRRGDPIRVEAGDASQRGPDEALSSDWASALR